MPTAVCLPPAKRFRKAAAGNPLNQLALQGKRSGASVPVYLLALVDQAEIELPRQAARFYRVLLAEDEFLAQYKRPVGREFGKQIDFNSRLLSFLDNARKLQLSRSSLKIRSPFIFHSCRYTSASLRARPIQAR
jgi:hypothetical protein